MSAALNHALGHLDSLDTSSVAACVIDTLIPAEVEKFPWAGHLGLAMLDDVIEAIEGSQSTLVFTNTRSQAELWYRGLIEARPDWAGIVALTFACWRLAS